MPRVDLEIRRARPSDRRGVVAAVRTNWGGDDYIPSVFDRWVTHRTGPFYVAVVRGRVVGMGKLTRQSAREAWLEGGRVAPRWRRRGIETALVTHRIRRATELGYEVVRFSTASNNTPIHRLARRLGFRRAHRFARYEAPAAHGQTPRVAEIGEVAALWRLVRPPAGPGLVQVGGGWDWRDLTRDELLRNVRARRVLVSGSPDRARAYAIVGTGHHRDTLLIRFAAGSDAARARLFAALRADARRRGFAKVSGYAVDGGSAAFVRAGYRRPWSEEAWFFERALNGSGSPRARSTSRRNTARDTLARNMRSALRVPSNRRHSAGRMR